MSSDTGSVGTTNLIEDWGPDPWGLDLTDTDPGSVDPGSTEGVGTPPTPIEAILAYEESGQARDLIVGAGSLTGPLRGIL